ncbi:MAG TPA: hypothetical protein VGE70_09105 [Burkholderiaceae bacterium]
MPAEALPLPDGPYAGRAAFALRVRAALVHAAAHGWNELVLSDADFDGWPLGEEAVCAGLHAWAAAGHRLAVLAGSYTVVEQRHARLVQFRRQWAHKIECRIAGREAATGLPSGIWTPDWLLTCDDREHWTGMATTVVRQRVAWRETLDAAWHRARPGFFATTLGL